MWATEDEPSQEIFGVYERTRAHADTTIEDLPLDGARAGPLAGAQPGDAARDARAHDR